jgi:hypothetical protein
MGWGGRKDGGGCFHNPVGPLSDRKVGNPVEYHSNASPMLLFGVRFELFPLMWGTVVESTDVEKASASV